MRCYGCTQLVTAHLPLLHVARGEAFPLALDSHSFGRLSSIHSFALTLFALLVSWNRDQQRDLISTYLP